MSNYEKGRRLEYKLANRLWEDGFAVCRQAGSGSVSHASADVIAVKDGVVYIFECKSHDDFPIDTSKDKKQLKEMRERAFPHESLHRESRDDIGECFYAFIKDGMIHVAPWSVNTITDSTNCIPYFKLVK